jgi:hypothetical protein
MPVYLGYDEQPTVDLCSSPRFLDSECLSHAKGFNGDYGELLLSRLNAHKNFGEMWSRLSSMQPLHQLYHPACHGDFVMKTGLDFSLPIELFDVSIKQAQLTAKYGDSTVVHAIPRVSWPCWRPTVWLNKYGKRLASDRAEYQPKRFTCIIATEDGVGSLPFQVLHFSAMQPGFRAMTACTPASILGLG